MQIVTNADFEQEVLKSDKPVLLKFFATWCGPCKLLAPTVEKVAAEKAGSVKTVAVDVDQSPELVKKYDIQSWPTLLVIRDGNVLSRKVGGDTKANILTWIDASLGGTAPKVVKRPGTRPKF